MYSSNHEGAKRVCLTVTKIEHENHIGVAMYRDFTLKRILNKIILVSKSNAKIHVQDCHPVGAS